MNLNCQFQIQSNLTIQIILRDQLIQFDVSNWIIKLHWFNFLNQFEKEHLIAFKWNLWLEASVIQFIRRLHYASVWFMRAGKKRLINFSRIIGYIHGWTYIDLTLKTVIVIWGVMQFRKLFCFNFQVQIAYNRSIAESRVEDP